MLLGSKSKWPSRQHLIIWRHLTDILQDCASHTLTGNTNATLALLELTPADGLKEKYEGIVYMDVQMLAVCNGLERSQVCALLPVSTCLHWLSH